MIDFIVGLLGKYTFEGFSLIRTFAATQLCVSLFAGRLRQRRYFFLRLAIAEVIGIAVCYFLAVLNTEVGTLAARVVCYLAIALMNFLFLFFSWDDSANELLLTYCSGLAAHQVIDKLYSLIQNLLGINDRETISLISGDTKNLMGWEWILFFAFHVFGYLLLSIVFRHKNKLTRDRKTSRSVALLSLMTVLTVGVLICVARTFEAESFALNIVVKIFSIGFGFVVLIVCGGIFTQNEQEQQINILNQLMKQEKTQFENVKANMDVINMKCHDLKHILNKIEGKLTEGEADSLREAIEFYDSNIKTGNEVLDVVLCEKAMTCQKNGIAFSCMANGERLDFLTPVQIYSLFGNIIDNAIEAVSKLRDENERVISLTVTSFGGELLIEESNFFSGELLISGGIPATVKEDSSRHGFGTKSIKYIAEQYGGTMEIKAEDNMFFLTVSFPLKQA